MDENLEKFGSPEKRLSELPFVVVASEGENKECESGSIRSSAIALQGSSDASS